MIRNDQHANRTLSMEMDIERDIIKLNEELKKNGVPKEFILESRFLKPDSTDKRFPSASDVSPKRGLRNSEKTLWNALAKLQNELSMLGAKLDELDRVVSDRLVEDEPEAKTSGGLDIDVEEIVKNSTEKVFQDMMMHMMMEKVGHIKKFHGLKEKEEEKDGNA